MLLLSLSCFFCNQKIMVDFFVGGHTHERREPHCPRRKVVGVLIITMVTRSCSITERLLVLSDEIVIEFKRRGGASAASSLSMKSAARILEAVVALNSRSIIFGRRRRCPFEGGLLRQTPRSRLLLITVRCVHHQHGRRGGGAPDAPHGRARDVLGVGDAVVIAVARRRGLMPRRPIEGQLAGHQYWRNTVGHMDEVVGMDGFLSPLLLLLLLIQELFPLLVLLLEQALLGQLTIGSVNFYRTGGFITF